MEQEARTVYDAVMKQQRKLTCTVYDAVMLLRGQAYWEALCKRGLGTVPLGLMTVALRRGLGKDPEADKRAHGLLQEIEAMAKAGVMPETTIGQIADGYESAVVDLMAKAKRDQDARERAHLN